MKYFFLFALFITIFISPLQSITIHVIGDSHTAEFGQIKGCSPLWLGPITMHRVGRDGLSYLFLPSLGVEERQAVVFCFGEIDVRCHILKQRDLHGRELKEIIKTLASNYIQTLQLNHALYKNLRIIVYSVTPPTDAHHSPRFPLYGSLQERVSVTKKLNKKLKKLSALAGFAFLDVFDDYADAEGVLKKELSDGTVHIDARFHEPIAQKLFKILETQ